MRRVEEHLFSFFLLFVSSVCLLPGGGSPATPSVSCSPPPAGRQEMLHYITLCYITVMENARKVDGRAFLRPNFQNVLLQYLICCMYFECKTMNMSILFQDLTFKMSFYKIYFVYKIMNMRIPWRGRRRASWSPSSSPSRRRAPGGPCSCWESLGRAWAGLAAWGTNG